MDTLRRRIRSEFDEAPGLSITVAQAARFWALNKDVCADVLTHLQNAGFLIRTDDGRYHRPGSE